VWIAIRVHKIIEHGIAGGNHPHPNLPHRGAVRGRFLNILGLEAHDHYISEAKENDPLYPHFLRGNPRNGKHS